MDWGAQKVSLACSTKTTLLLLSHLPHSLSLSAFEDHEDKLPSWILRVQWQDRRGGGGVGGIISGMCVNCTPPPINQGDKQEEEEEGKQGGEELESVWRSDRRNDKINKWWWKEGCRCKRVAPKLVWVNWDKGAEKGWMFQIPGITMYVWMGLQLH